ncbi:MAG TPA: FAD:protein FMN transferase [Rhodothermales bacterium]|nr:FAD:protein FMN transferase [Rhodothermales bacterium]
MGTRFELALYGGDTVRLRAAGEEAVAQILRLHRELTAFRAESQVGRINGGASTGPVRVSAELFSLLVNVRRLSELTDGAFDVTVGPLLEAWGFRGERKGFPDERTIAEALARVGFQHVLLNAGERSVSFGRPGMRLDLGGVGKGYALDVAIDVLRSAGVTCALIHGGTSTVRAIGLNPEGKSWKIGVRRPFAGAGEDLLEVVALEDNAMSVSAVSGRFFEVGGDVYGHVIDPRTGYPTGDADLAVVFAPSAMEADAMSTGLLVLGEAGISMLEERVEGFMGASFRNVVVATSSQVTSGCPRWQLTPEVTSPAAPGST